MSNKIALAMKENKQSAQMVKLGEKQIEQITEKMDQFKNENMKFKAGMKEKFYSMDVRSIPLRFFNRDDLTSRKLFKTLRCTGLSIRRRSSSPISNVYLMKS